MINRQFVFVFLLLALVESIWLNTAYFNIFIPATLPLLALMSKRKWLRREDLFLLAAITGFIFDDLGAIRSGQVLTAFLVFAGFIVLTERLKRQWFSYLAALAAYMFTQLLTGGVLDPGIITRALPILAALALIQYVFLDKIMSITESAL